MQHDCQAKGAAAGLWTTPSDLARFAIALQKAWQGESGRILSKTLAVKMLSKQFEDFGLGVGLSADGETAHFEHGGANEGFRRFLAAVANGQGAVIMTNSDGGGNLAQEILGTIADEYDWPQYHD